MSFFRDRSAGNFKSSANFFTQRPTNNPPTNDSISVTTPNNTSHNVTGSSASDSITRSGEKSIPTSIEDDTTTSFSGFYTDLKTGVGVPRAARSSAELNESKIPTVSDHGEDEDDEDDIISQGTLELKNKYLEKLDEITNDSSKDETNISQDDMSEDSYLISKAEKKINTLIGAKVKQLSHDDEIKKKAPSRLSSGQKSSSSIFCVRQKDKPRLKFSSKEKYLSLPKGVNCVKNEDEIPQSKRTETKMDFGINNLLETIRNWQTRHVAQENIIKDFQQEIEQKSLSLIETAEKIKSLETQLTDSKMLVSSLEDKVKVSEEQVQGIICELSDKESECAKLRDSVATYKLSLERETELVRASNIKIKQLTIDSERQIIETKNFTQKIDKLHGTLSEEKLKSMMLQKEIEKTRTTYDSIMKSEIEKNHSSLEKLLINIKSSETNIISGLKNHNADFISTKLGDLQEAMDQQIGNKLNSIVLPHHSEWMRQIDSRLSEMNQSLELIKTNFQKSELKELENHKGLIVSSDQLKSRLENINASIEIMGTKADKSAVCEQLNFINAQINSNHQEAQSIRNEVTSLELEKDELEKDNKALQEKYNSCFIEFQDFRAKSEKKEINMKLDEFKYTEKISRLEKIVEQYKSEINVAQETRISLLNTHEQLIKEKNGQINGLTSKMDEILFKYEEQNLRLETSITSISDRNQAQLLAIEGKAKEILEVSELLNSCLKESKLAIIQNLEQTTSVLSNTILSNQSETKDYQIHRMSEFFALNLDETKKGHEKMKYSLTEMAKIISEFDFMELHNNITNILNSHIIIKKDIDGMVAALNEASNIRNLEIKKKTSTSDKQAVLNKSRPTGDIAISAPVNNPSKTLDARAKKGDKQPITEAKTIKISEIDASIIFQSSPKHDTGQYLRNSSSRGDIGNEEASPTVAMKNVTKKGKTGKKRSLLKEEHEIDPFDLADSPKKATNIVTHSRRRFPSKRSRN
ncbi:hypothetical protein DASC09_050570 [Saccharomycopsis crataegensis]|uniref:Uncharacterized protein n=1 Tax=Saccharomycopsis crataegensis TaxID=43959 RepID=A0AAV5QTJ8_9ASCO|nr:hypothetical protein DASC09_050570 [Saccharomycopsis crataegensis]